MLTPLALMLGLIVAMVAPGFALKRANARDDSGQATPDALVMVLGVAGLALLVLAAILGLGLEHGSACAGMALPALRIRTLYPYAHRSPTRDDEAPQGWVMTLYRTTPKRTEHGIGIESTPLDTAWFPTRDTSRMAAQHIGWKLNGERVPGSSYGWTGKVGSPDGAWRYGFSCSADPAWHGYACEWRAVGTVADHSPMRLYTVDLGPMVFGRATLLPRADALTPEGRDTRARMVMGDPALGHTQLCTVDLGPIRTYARDVLYDWSGDTRAYVDGLSDSDLARRISEYMGMPYSLGTLYRDGLDEAMLAAEEHAARASASPDSCECDAVMSPADRVQVNALHRSSCTMFDPQGED